MTALLQAPVLERRELERQPARSEDASADHCRMGRQPRRCVHRVVRQRIPKEGERPEDAPDHRVPVRNADIATPARRWLPETVANSRTSGRLDGSIIAATITCQASRCRPRLPTGASRCG